MTIAIYVFPDINLAQAARAKIASIIGAGAAFWSGNCVEIQDECQDMGAAVQICRAFGGRAQ